MDNEHLKAVEKLKDIFKSFNEKTLHKNNVDLARRTFPYNYIPYSVKKEIWKPLTDKRYIEDRYLISSWGRVFDTKYNYYVKTYLSKGYIRTAVEINPMLTDGDKVKFVSIGVHRLVGLAFIPLIEGKEDINHKDLKKRNNLVENLEWVTNIENLDHAYKNNARDSRGYCYFTKEEIAEIREKRKNGETITSIAKLYNKDDKTISNIVNYKSYKDDFWDNLGFTSEEVSYYRLRK